MIVTRKSLARRTFLRGLGTTLALPFLDAMVPALKAGTAAKPAVRTAFVYVPNGIIMKEWTPAADGTGWEFMPSMKAMEPFRENMLVLSGLAQVNGRALSDGAGDHARAGATWLTGVHPKKTEVDIRAGISADQVLAKELGKATQLGSLEIGLESPSLAGGCDSGYSCAYTNTISWRNPTTPMPMEVNPRNVFERLFGDGESTDPAARMAAMKEQSSILDYLRGDVARLSSGLGAPDRNKLDQYLDSIRDIERRIQKAEEQNAAMKMPVMERPAGAPEEFVDHAHLMMDLQVLAFQADMTRVISFMIAREGSNRSYREIGVNDGHHSCTHHMNDPVKIGQTAKINTHHVETFAYLIDKMKSTPDGDGSLLDHSQVLYGSSISDGNAHTHHDLPILLIGGAGGNRFPASPVEGSHEAAREARMGTRLTTVVLLAAATGFAQPLTISVQMIDDYGAPKGTVSAAQRDAAHILGMAGVKLDWHQAKTPGGLTLYLLERRMVPTGGDALGYALIDPISGSGCNCAHMVFPAIESVARQWQTSNSTVLGAVIAHEIGHLLLNSSTHSSSGIMSANFGYSQIAEASRGDLLFTEEQAAILRSRVALFRGTRDLTLAQLEK
jgi:hypothetical protein